MTLPESTPVHEAMALEKDLLRAEIRPFAWIVNQSLTPHEITDTLLAARRSRETRYIGEVTYISAQTYLIPWLAQPQLSV